MKNTDTFRQFCWLINTLLQAKKMSLEQIQARWIDDNLNERKPLSRTTFYRLRQAIEDMFGIIIGCDPNDDYHYSITNPEVLKDNSTQNWMLQTLTVNNILTDSLSVKDRLVLEEIPEGMEYLQTIIKAIKRNHRLTMGYQKFTDPLGYTVTIEPYCLKMFRQRWYLLGKNITDKKDLQIYALDRVTALKETDQIFTLNPDFHADVFFKHYFGAFISNDEPPVHIVLRAYGKMIPLLRTLPKHPSQKEIVTTKKYSDFEYFLIPTFDFRQEILREGSELEVLEPESFRKELFEETKKAYLRYKSHQLP